MASNQHQTSALEALYNNVPEPAIETFDKFHLFPNLPAELRLKIWKTALVGRRVVIRKSTLDLHPPHDMSYLALRWACFDSRKVWNESFMSALGDASSGVVRNPVYYNFDVDILAIDGGLGALASVTRMRSEDLRKIQYLEVRTPHSNTERRLEMSHQVTDQFIRALRQTPSLKMITVIWDFRVRTLPFPQVDDPAEFSEWHERFLISTLESLRRSLHAAIGPTVPYNGPQLACLFPPTEAGIEERYFRTSHDLQHASFGTLVGDSKVYQDPQVEWLEKNGPWTDDFYGSSNIFCRLAASRTKINTMLPVEPQLLISLQDGSITRRDVQQYLEFDKRFVAYTDRMARTYGFLGVRGVVEDRAHRQQCNEALETQVERSRV